MKVWTSLAAAALCGRFDGAADYMHDHIFGNHFDYITDLPANTNEAARFLTQATFGPYGRRHRRVMQLGYGEWIDEQLGLPATLEHTAVTVDGQSTSERHTYAQNSGADRTTESMVVAGDYAPDQLRQRMAFALGQIFVVSDQNSAIGNDNVPMSAYQDMLAKDAFALLRRRSKTSPTADDGQVSNAFHNIEAAIAASCATPFAHQSGRKLRARNHAAVFGGSGPAGHRWQLSKRAACTIPTYDQSVISTTAEGVYRLHIGTRRSAIRPDANGFLRRRQFFRRRVGADGVLGPGAVSHSTTTACSMTSPATMIAVKCRNAYAGRPDDHRLQSGVAPT